LWGFLSQSFFDHFLVSEFFNSHALLRKLSWILVGSVIGANVGFKLFVALQLEVAHHFMERFAFRGTGGFEPPSTFGATKTLKTLPLNPYQLPAHGCLYRANEYQRAVIRIKDRSLHTPILMVCRASYISRFCSGERRIFPWGVLQSCLLLECALLLRLGFQIRGNFVSDEKGISTNGPAR
jgi:hypothetical protein